jgi:hypothetical protein
MAIEDGEHLGRSPVTDDRVRRHGVELGGLSDFDEMLPFAESQTDGPL